MKIYSLNEFEKLKSFFFELKKIVLNPYQRTKEIENHCQEQLLYVIIGNGFAVINDKKYIINQEDILYLNKGDKYYFTTNDNGLEILHGYVPESKIHTLSNRN